MTGDEARSGKNLVPMVTVLQTDRAVGCFPLSLRVRIIDRGAGRIYRAMFTPFSVTRLISERPFNKGCGTVIAPLKGAGAIHESKGA
jgi:hypothetical protein